MPKSKVSAFFSVLIVFVSGAAVGAMGHRLYVVNTAVVSKAPKITPAEVRKRIVTHMKDAIKLDDQQVGQLQQILDHTRDSWSQVRQRVDAEVEPIKKRGEAERDKIHAQQISQIRAILRPDQQALYDKWEADRQADWQRRQQQRNSNKK